MQEQYNSQEIELNAQTYWQEKNCFQVTEDANKEKIYCLPMCKLPLG